MAAVIVPVSRFTDGHQPGFVDGILPSALGESCISALGESCMSARPPWRFASKAGPAGFTLLLAQWVLVYGPA